MCEFVCVCVQSVCVFCAIRVCVCVCVCVFVCNPCVCLWPPGANVCVRVFVKVRPGCQKYRILQCLGRPGCAKKAKIFIVAGAPIPEKNDFRSRYVCVFVHVLMAKTTIGKSMCVFVCNPCVCFVPSVCVFGVHFVCVCVFVADFSPQITWSVWACL